MNADELKRTVLLVDDETRVRKSLAEYLEEEGYRTLESENTAGLEKALTAEGTTVDLVLLDVRMPDEDGVAFLKRCPELVRETPIIMMSGHTTRPAVSQIRPRSRTLTYLYIQTMATIASRKQF